MIAMIVYIKKIVTFAVAKGVSGCSSARLEYASGGRVVGRSNRLTPTADYQRLTTINCKSFLLSGTHLEHNLIVNMSETHILNNSDIELLSFFTDCNTLL